MSWIVAKMSKVIALLCYPPSIKTQTQRRKRMKISFKLLLNRNIASDIDEGILVCNYEEKRF